MEATEERDVKIVIRNGEVYVLYIFSDGTLDVWEMPVFSKNDPFDYSPTIQRVEVDGKYVTSTEATFLERRTTFMQKLKIVSPTLADTLACSTAWELRTVISATSSASSPSMVSYAPTINDVCNVKRRHFIRFGKWLQKMVDAKLLQLSPQEVQEIATRWNGLNNGYSFEVRREQGVYDTYKAVACSCMSQEGGEPSPAIQLYVKNPKKVGILACLYQGETVGRALVWSTDSGETLLDRCYPTDGTHQEAMRDYAKKQGWIVRLHNSGSALEPSSYLFPDGSQRHATEREFSVTLEDCGAYPYMDTFKYADIGGPDKNGKFTLRTRSPSRYAEFTNTDNSSPWKQEPDWTCNDCEEGFSEDDDYTCVYNGYHRVCDSCLENYTYIESYQGYYPQDDCSSCEYCDEAHRDQDLTSIDTIARRRSTVSLCEDCASKAQERGLRLHGDNFVWIEDEDALVDEDYVSTCPSGEHSYYCDSQQTCECEDENDDEEDTSEATEEQAA